MVSGGPMPFTKTAKLGLGNGPHLDFDGRTALCDSNQARPVRGSSGQRVQGVERTRARPGQKVCSASRQLVIER